MQWVAQMNRRGLRVAEMNGRRLSALPSVRCHVGKEAGRRRTGEIEVNEEDATQGDVEEKKDDCPIEIVAHCLPV
ncbi:unnamed protein product [Sphenostylis stenocarpa]|uniref:Uncharacterized protein n=1 Tax=Sphenostylis stenocarpa TaxID=92480 RepID=A0AA86V4T2_9FABA|nr:unnamed protein product [Sphenostylis stenocarpa]